MSLPVVVYLLTALAAVVIVLTRVRLAGAAGGGRVIVSPTLLTAHTIVGSAALVVWLVFLIGGDSLGETPAGVVGIIALAFWWSLSVLGLMISIRWLPSRGRHAGQGHPDRWGSGPALSVLAHFGMLLGVAVFTYAYLVNAV